MLRKSEKERKKYGERRKHEINDRESKLIKQKTDGMNINLMKVRPEKAKKNKEILKS